MATIAWEDGHWTHAPESVTVDDVLTAEAKAGSDAWRDTSYGFIHDTEHALLSAWPHESAVEVDFFPDFSEQFDQAGLMIRADHEHWVKAGLEFSDGILQLGAVVTWPKSDWSVAPVPAWNRTPVTIRASRSADAVTLRARSHEGDWQFVRVLPIPPDAVLEAGPFLCAPTRSGLTVRFTDWRIVEKDASLH